jgi:hypothetical protein
MLEMPSSFKDTNQDTTPQEERWLWSLTEPDPNSEGRHRFRDGFHEQLSGAELACLSRRLLARGSLKLPPSLEAELLCMALAEGVVPLGAQVREALANCGIPGPDDQALIPAPVPWTACGLLSSPITLALDSPVVHAFLVQQGEQVNEVLVIGRGCGEMRRRLQDVAFLAALASPRPSRELEEHERKQLEREAENAEADGEVETAARLRRCIEAFCRFEPAEVLDGLIWLSRSVVDPNTGFPLAATGGKDYLEDPFLLLVQELRKLARTSALLQLHTVSPAQVQRFRPSLRPGLFFDQDHAHPDRPLVAAVGPVWAEDEPLTLEIPLRVLESDLFQQVERTLVRARAERTKADAQDRWRFHERHRKEDQNALDEYHCLPPDLKEERDREVHRLNLRVNHELGVEYVLRKPDFKTGKWYFQVNLPSLVRDATVWAERMARVYSKVEAAENDNRLRRLAVGFLLDRALRGLGPVEGDPSWPELADWQQRVRPLLLQTWQTALDRAVAGEASRFATRRLFFLASFGAGKVTIRPYYLFVNTTGVLDSRGPVQRLVDRIDHLTNREMREDHGKKALQHLEAALGPDPNLGDETVAVLLNEALQAAPQAAAQKLCAHLIGLAPPAPTAAEEANPLLAQQVLSTVESLMAVGAWHAAAYHLIAFLAGAVAKLPPFRLEQNQLPDVPCRFLLLCGQLDPDPAPAWDLVKRWLERWQKNPHDPALPDHVRQAMELAHDWGKEERYLAKCLGSRDGRGKARPRVWPSTKLKDAIRMGPTAAAWESLLEHGGDALRAAAAIARARRFPNERTPARRMYRLLGDALARVMAGSNGAALGREVQELSSPLLGAEHYLEEHDRRSGENWGGATS